MPAKYIIKVEKQATQKQPKKKIKKLKKNKILSGRRSGCFRQIFLPSNTKIVKLSPIWLLILALQQIFTNPKTKFTYMRMVLKSPKEFDQKQKPQ